MANDAVGLLDALGIERAHIVGASMGGMLVQTIAIEHPERCLSMTSIMSSPGDPRAGKPTKEALAFLMTPPPTEREAYIANAEQGAIIASKRYFDPAKARARAAVNFDRSFYPEGAPRQLAAIYASGDRTDQLQRADGAVARPARSRRHAHHARGRDADRRGDPRRQPTCCSPTWATTSPSRCGP